jgi:hypothetical protein
MKHSLKNPQQKNKCHVSYLNKSLKIELGDVKVKNIMGNVIECHIPIKQNANAIDVINELDNLSLKTLLENPEWINNNDVKNLYNFSYTDDISNLNVLLNNKSCCYFNDNEISIEETIEIIRDNIKLKDYNIIMEISFLGLFIYDYAIINKWSIKTIKIDDMMDDFGDWNKSDIEDDWELEINNFETIVKNKIEEYNNAVKEARLLLNEIRKETNISIWEKNITKLKKYILKL